MGTRAHSIARKRTQALGKIGWARILNPEATDKTAVMLPAAQWSLLLFYHNLSPLWASYTPIRGTQRTCIRRQCRIVMEPLLRTRDDTPCPALPCQPSHHMSCFIRVISLGHCQTWGTHQEYRIHHNVPTHQWSPPLWPAPIHRCPLLLRRATG